MDNPDAHACQRNKLIKQLEALLRQKVEVSALFTRALFKSGRLSRSFA